MKVVFCFLVFIASLNANLSLMPNQAPGHLVVNNRILMTIQGKAISVIDVMKQMDMFLQRYYPEAFESLPARYQFYSTNWKETLLQMIDHELIKADAEGKELSITDSDVRETLQKRFGPNVTENLDKIGLTYEEAKQMIRDELVVQQMTAYRINVRALYKVLPQTIKNAYREFYQKNPPQSEWKYEVLSFRVDDQKCNEELAHKAYDLLQTSRAGFLAVCDKIKEMAPKTTEPQILVQEYSANEKNISSPHKEALISLKPGEYSKPIGQTTRLDNKLVFRIFHLIEYAKKNPPSFDELATDIENKLLEEAVAQETAHYLPKLRERFGYSKNQVEELLPKNFEPFSLK